MKYCPRCRRRIPDHFRECPFDLGPLELSEPKGLAVDLASASSSKPPPQAARTIPLMAKPRIFAKGAAKTTTKTVSRSGRIQRFFSAFLSLLLGGGLSFSIVFLFVYYRPKHTQITVKSEPSGAVVYLDEKKLGMTPMEGKVVPLGIHRLRINKKGFFEASRTLRLREGMQERIKETLEPVSGRVLSKEESRQVEDWTRKAERALAERIFFPPPEDYSTATLCRRILEIDPENGFALETIKKVADQTRESAEAAFQKGEWREAQRLYTDLFSLMPEDASIQYRLEELRQGILRTEEQKRNTIQQLTQGIENAFTAESLSPPTEGNAYDLIRQLQRLDPRNIFARNARIRLLQRSSEVSRKLAAEGKWSDAQRVLYYAVQLSPDDAELKSQQQALQEKASSIQQANDERTRQLELQRQQELRRQELRLSVLAAYRSGRYEQVVEDLQQLEKISPLDEEMHFLRGSSWQQMRQYRQALQAFESCIAQNPKRAEAVLQMAVIYQYSLKDLARAERYFQRLLQLGGSGEYDPPRLQRILQELQQQALFNQRVNQPLEVEHRHGIGSCQGKVIWGGVTMQFWSNEKSHSFLRPYAQITKLERRNDTVEIQFPDKKYTFRFKSAEDIKWVIDWLTEKRNPRRGTL